MYIYTCIYMYIYIHAYIHTYIYSYIKIEQIDSIFFVIDKLPRHNITAT